MNPEPGWYPDPEVPFSLRWWDGAMWTEHTTALSPPNAENSRTPRSTAQWLSYSFEIFGRLWRFFLPAALLLTLVPQVALAGLMWWASDGIFITLPGTESDEFGGNILYPARLYYLGFGVVAVVIIGTLYVALVRRQAIRAMAGGVLPWKQELASMLTRSPRILLTAIGWLLALLVVYIVFVGIVAVSSLQPLLLIITIPGALVAFVWIAVRIGYVLAAAAVAPSGTSAWAQSLAITNRRVRTHLGRMVIVWAIVLFGQGMINGVVSSANSPAQPLTVLDRTTLMGENVWVVLSLQAVAAVVVAFGAAWRAIAVSVNYHDYGGIIDPELTQRA